MHRVYEVRGDEIITWGDGNPEPDTDPVIESGYVGKVVWFVNYVGRVLQVLCNPWFFSILFGCTVILLVLKRMSTPTSTSPTPEK